MPGWLLRSLGLPPLKPRALHELDPLELGILPLIPVQCSLADLSHGSSVLAVVGGPGLYRARHSALALRVIILQVHRAYKLGTKLPPPRFQRMYQTAQGNAYCSTLDGTAPRTNISLQLLQAQYSSASRRLQPTVTKLLGEPTPWGSVSCE